MQRRSFLATCATGALVAGVDALREAAAQSAPRIHGRARLIDSAGRAIRAAEIPIGRTLVFHYPFVGTPAFLLNLGSPTPEQVRLESEGLAPYQWRGGVGPWRSVVAYAAICSHQMAYPRRDNSFIAFRQRPGPVNTRGRVIHCCAEHSEFDPAEGARVLSGPATRPLTAILLSHDPQSDTLLAIGTQGPELYQAFFAKYDVPLEIAHGGRAREQVVGTSMVEPLEQFSRHRVDC